MVERAKAAARLSPEHVEIDRRAAPTRVATACRSISTRPADANPTAGPRQRAVRMSSTRCLASPKSICEFSRKNSGFCTPA